MSETMILNLARQSLETLLLITTPMLVVGMTVGVTVSILQVVTSIQDATLAFVPRAIAVFVVFLVSLPWIIHQCVNYTTVLFSNFGQYTR
ncbi:MAG TPA: flagellar biosynthetic protein FliQ [Terriglobia bacterium]|nr:flagellar biosynthetic protein FliQ [Terriglobia bacterium]